MRDPGSDTESRLPGFAVPPCRWSLVHLHASSSRFCDELDAHLKAAFTRNTNGLGELGRVGLEGIGRIPRPDASEVVQDEACKAGEDSLEDWSADLSASAHVTGRRCNDCSPFDEASERVDIGGIVASVSPHDNSDGGCDVIETEA